MAAHAQRVTRFDVRIQRAIDLIAANYGKSIGVPDLAEAVGLSISHFSHLFRDNVGVSPAKFLRDLRMCEAERLMMTTALPLSAIFPRVGVTDRSHFVRKFRQCYGLAPSIYRARQSLENRNHIHKAELIS
jgi:AraC-like DNA-binding protein